MTSARVKSEQAEEAAKRAKSDSELARSRAKEFSPGSNYQVTGAKVIANRLQEDELLAEFADLEAITEPTQEQLMQQAQSTKKFSFFSRLKRPENKAKPDIRSTFSKDPSTLKLTNQTLYYNTSGAHSNHNFTDGITPSQQTQIANSRVLQNNATLPRSIGGGGGLTANMPTFSAVNGMQARQGGEGPMYERSTRGAMLGSFPMQQGGMSMGNRVPETAPPNYGHAFDDAYGLTGYGEASRERRKSLPSIVKQPTEGILSGAVSGIVKPEAQKPAQPSSSSVTSGSVARRKQVDTFVIEDGVRKRVKSLYGEEPKIPNTTSASGATLVRSTTTKLPKMYALESPKLYRKGDKGSVPDVHAVRDEEVLPREVVYVMSQQRREELMVERAAEEQRRRNQIVLRLGDLKDWCDRRRMLMFVLAVNLSLATVFYSMLQ